MLKQIKQILIRKLQTYRPNYINESKLNVLIQLNSFFTKNSWLNKVEKILVNKNNINFVFLRKKIQILRTINYCDAGFLFDLSNSYLNSSTKLKVIYLGVSGNEFNSSFMPELKVYSSKGISAKSISEYVLANTIFIINKYNNCIENKVFRRWKQNLIIESEYNSIEKFKIGIWGVGNNGRAIAEKFGKLGCQVFGCDLKVSNDFPFIHKWFLFKDFDKFCDEIDILIISVSSDIGKKFQLDYNFIKKHLKHKYIINIARANFINQKDLKKCLREKILSGAVLDVFEKEPLPFYDSLWHFKNLIITPHISGNINRFVSIIQEDFLNKIAMEFNLKVKI